jgi:hypothetical protein
VSIWLVLQLLQVKRVLLTKLACLLMALREKGANILAGNALPDQL